LNAPYTGGLLGHTMHQLVFRHFGKAGATIIFCTLYIIRLIFLTNFQLGPWLRARLTALRRRSAADSDPDNKEWSPEEKVLARKARELERQARKLQEQIDQDRPKDKEKAKDKGSEEARPDDKVPSRTGLGPDLRPVPAPTVRDLSLPNTRAGKGAKSRVEEPAIEKGELEG